MLQEISNEQLSKGANKAADARLDIRARGFWEKQRSAVFDIRVCFPNADTYKDLELSNNYKLQEEEKKRKYAERVNEIEHGTFTPLVFTTTGEMSKECKTSYSRECRESYLFIIFLYIIRIKVSLLTYKLLLLYYYCYILLLLYIILYHYYIILLELKFHY